MPRLPAYCRSKNGAWHVLVGEHGELSLTSCGLALRGALVDSLPPQRPRVRPCESCKWPEGYPKWPNE